MLSGSSTRTADSRRGSKAEQVYADIKADILAGRFEPGAPIDKPALCARLGVSRFPVSTAINRLAFERLVVIEPQHGSFVGKIAAHDVREWMLMRRGLETEIAGELALALSAADRTALERNLRYQLAAAEAGDTSGFYLQDIEFHRLLGAGLGLLQAMGILEGLRSNLERIRRMLLTPPDRMPAAYAEHKAIFTALENGDRQSARAAMSAHLKHTTAMFEDFAKSHPGMFST